MNMSGVERDAYEDHLKWMRIENNTLKKYEDRGEKRGLQKGIEQRNIEVAKQMLEKGLAIGTIESISGLSKQELEKIKKG